MNNKFLIFSIISILIIGGVVSYLYFSNNSFVVNSTSIIPTTLNGILRFAEGDNETLEPIITPETEGGEKVLGNAIFIPFNLSLTANKETTYLNKKYRDFNGAVISSSLKAESIWYPDQDPRANQKEIRVEFQVDKNNKHYSFLGIATTDKYFSSDFDLNFSNSKIAIFQGYQPNFTWTYSTNYTEEIESVLVDRNDNGDTYVNRTNKIYKDYQPLTKPMQNAIKTGLDNVDLFLDPSVGVCGTISTSGTYTLNTSIIATEDCMDIDASNVNFTCAGYNLTFGSGNISASYGIKIDNGEDQIRIYNCNFRFYGNMTGSNAILIQTVANPNNINIYNNNFTFYSIPTSTTRSIQLNIASTSFNVTNNTFTGPANYSNSNGFNIGASATSVLLLNVENNVFNYQNMRIANATYGRFFNNKFYNASLIATYDTARNNIFYNNIVYYDSTYAITVSDTTRNNTFYNNYFENIDPSRLTHIVYYGENYSSNYTFYNNTFNVSGLGAYTNAPQNPNWWNKTLGNYYTNSSVSGYSDTCAVTLTDYVCDDTYNLSTGNNTDYKPISYNKIISDYIAFGKNDYLLYYNTGTDNFMNVTSPMTFSSKWSESFVNAPTGLIIKDHPFLNYSIILAGDEDGILNASFWNGSAFYNKVNIDTKSICGSSTEYRLGEDVAFEQLSGDILVAYINSSYLIEYATYDGTWNYFNNFTTNYSNSIVQLRLYPNPHNNEIMLLFETGNYLLYGTLWDGNSFGQTYLINGSISNQVTGFIAEGIWTEEDTFIATYDVEGAGEDLKYSLWNGYSWEESKDSGFTAGVSDVAYMKMATNNSGGNVGCLLDDGSNFFIFSMNNSGSITKSNDTGFGNEGRTGGSCDIAYRNSKWVSVFATGTSGGFVNDSIDEFKVASYSSEDMDYNRVFFPKTENSFFILTEYYDISGSAGYWLTIFKYNAQTLSVIANIPETKLNAGGYFTFDFMETLKNVETDDINPIITIYSPENISYNYRDIPLIVSANEGIDTWWYSKDLGATNNSFTPGETIDWNDGSNKVLVYANDTFGNVGNASVTFFATNVYITNDFLLGYSNAPSILFKNGTINNTWTPQMSYVLNTSRGVDIYESKLTNLSAIVVEESVGNLTFFYWNGRQMYNKVSTTGGGYTTYHISSGGFESLSNNFNLFHTNASSIIVSSYNSEGQFIIKKHIDAIGADQSKISYYPNPSDNTGIILSESSDKLYNYYWNGSDAIKKQTVNGSMSVNYISDKYDAVWLNDGSKLISLFDPVGNAKKFTVAVYNKTDNNWTYVENTFSDIGAVETEYVNIEIGPNNNVIVGCSKDLSDDLWLFSINTTNNFNIENEFEAETTASSTSANLCDFGFTGPKDNFIGFYSSATSGKILNNSFGMSAVYNFTTNDYYHYRVDSSIYQDVILVAMGGDNNFNLTTYIYNTTSNTGSFQYNQYNTNPSPNHYDVLINDAGYTDTTPPTITISSPTNTTYNTLTIPLTVSANEGIDTWWYSNDSGATTHIFTSGTSFDWNIGTNTVQVYANDTAGNIGNKNVTFFIDLEYPVFSNYNETPANASEYSPNTKYQFNITIKSTNGSIQLQFNNLNYSASGTNGIYNVTLPSLGAGNYSYQWNAFGNGSTHIYNVSDIYYYTVLINNSLELGITGTTPINYGTITDVVGSGCPTQLTCTLSPSNAIYGAGSKFFNYSANGNNNYTQNKSATINITINQVNGLIRTYINNTETHFTSNNGTAIRLNATLVTGTGKIYLLLNGTLINNGTSPISNLTNLSIGYYNLTGFYDGNENYTADNEYWFINITEGPDSVGPKCTLISRTPADINDSSTGILNVIMNCTDISGINLTQTNINYPFFITRTVDAFILAQGIPNYWSNRYPNNSLGVKGTLTPPYEIWKALGRNRGFWYENLTILKDCQGISPCYNVLNDTFSYAIEDGQYGHFVINSENPENTSVIINYTHPAIDISAFRQSVYLSYEGMVSESKNNYTVDNGHYVLTKRFDAEAYRGTKNYTMNSYRNFGIKGSPMRTLRAFYCNNSYSPSGSIKVIDSPNCNLINSFTSTEINNIIFTDRNSSYSKSTYAITNGKFGGIVATAEFYIEYESPVVPSAGYYLRYANGTAITDIGFNDTKVAWTSTNAGTTWTQASWTPDVFTTSVRATNDEFDFGYLFKDYLNNYGYNFTFVRDLITLTNHPITNPTILEYNSTAYSMDIDLNETHKGIMNIYVGIATDPDSVGNVTHNLTLRNLDGTWNYTISPNFTSPTDADMWVSFNTSLVLDGEYRMNITAYSGDDKTDVESRLTDANFTIDNTKPVFTNIHNITVKDNESVEADFNATDIRFDNWKINWTTNFTINSSGFFYNSSQLYVGIYYVNVSINDTVGNKESIVIWVNVTSSAMDEEYPVFSNHNESLANGSVYTPNIKYHFNITILSTNTSVKLEFQGVNYTATNFTKNRFNVTLNNLGVNNYSYQWNAFGNGTNHWYNVSNIYDYTIIQNVSNVSLTLNGTKSNVTINTGSIIYLNCSKKYGDSGAIISLYNNGTLINSGVSPIYNATNFTYISVMNITCIYEVTQNYSSESETYYVDVLNVTDVEYPVFSNFNETPANGSEYSPSVKYQFNISILSTNGSVGLEFNGINYTANSVVSGKYNVTLPMTLGAGNYTYYWYAWGNGTNENYNVSNVYDYSVSINSTLSLGITGTTPITFGTLTNVAGNNCPTQLTCSVAPANAVYGAGSVVFNHSTEGNSNYSSNWTYKTITINKATGIIFTYLDGARANKNSNNNTPINISTIINVGVGYVSLFVNGTLWNNGTTWISNTTEFVEGVYNISGTYTGNDNYTEASESWTLTITNATAPIAPSNVTSAKCRYKYFGYWNDKLAFYKESGCV